MPRALKACGTCGQPSLTTPCQGCKPPGGTHTLGAKQRGNTRRMATLAKRAIQAQPWCAWPDGCTLPIGPDNPLTADHIIPRSKAPHLIYDPTNLMVLCRTHNSRKGTRTLDPRGQLAN